MSNFSKAPSSSIAEKIASMYETPASMLINEHCEPRFYIHMSSTIDTINYESVAVTPHGTTVMWGKTKNNLDVMELVLQKNWVTEKDLILDWLQIYTQQQDKTNDSVLQTMLKGAPLKVMENMYKAMSTFIHSGQMTSDKAIDYLEDY